MFGKAPLISCIFPKPMGSNTSPPNSGLKEALRDVAVLPVCTGAKAAAEPTRAERRASFMVDGVKEGKFEEVLLVLLKR